ncbi:sugar porter (SP) family MFS transporter [Haloferula luteola]|uniref:Sugar porter (SP) family MFS transporter n=1 Tax=Haloferula luteola TaxID=595692 RepID=A0A840V0C3_9BACT|nr:sugar porter family MFS transporter [Haloferula luteola]MBB5351445.1 sugar porter (SP) family MFS transporter [Haloferula luteola]
MNRIVYWSITAALAGFLFGFDTVVISGAEQSFQQLWGLDSTMHGLAMSMALWGTVVGSLVASWPADRWGRRQTLLWIGVFYFVSAVWSGLAGGVYSFMVARFIGGLGVGISTVVAPLFISEIAPADKRGRLAGMFQFNIVFGILIAFVSNRMLSGLGDNAWRWMLGAEAIPALAYSLMCFGLPESPRWLIGKRQQREEGAGILRRIYPDASDAEIAEKVEEIAAAADQSTSAGPFWCRRLRTPILLAFLIAFFNQLSGINAVLYFAPRIFEMAGLEKNAALLQSVGIGLTNLVFTFVGLWMIDRFGRRSLLFIGSVGYIISLGLCAWSFSAIEAGNTGAGALVPYFVFAFIAAHAVGQGAVIWVFISEIFPNLHRAQGTSLGSFTHWIFAALLTLFFPSMVEKFAPAVVFGFFGFMMAVQLFWVMFMVPETKGRPLEEIEKLWKS